MADINQQIQQILTAHYGEDVRQSIVGGLTAMNGECENANTVAQDMKEKRDSGYFNGAKGDAGTPGEKGDTALSLSIGSVSLGEAGSVPTVTNSGTDTDLILDFVLPLFEIDDGEIN